MQRYVAWRAALAALIVGALSCNPTQPRAASAPQALQSEAAQVQSFELSDVSPSRILDLPDPNINDTPIQVWVSKSRSGEIGQIRITGHANAEVCSQASLDLLALLADRSNVEGFLNFGVAELRPASGAKAYAQKASTVVDELSSLAEEYPAFVQIHELTLSQSDAAAMPPGGAEKARAATLRFRSPDAGPAYVPLRSWVPGRDALPLRFDVSAAELGVDEALMQQLAPSIASAPLVDRISLLRDRIERLERLEKFLQGGGSLVFHALGYLVSPETDATSVDDLTRYNLYFTRFERYLDASRFLSEQPKSIRIRQEAEAREIASHSAANESCLALVRSGRRCWRYFKVDPMVPGTDREREQVVALDAELAAFGTLPSTVFDLLRVEEERALGQARKALIVARGEVSSEAKSSARETVIDGLLRGWPIPLPEDKKIERRILDIQTRTAPEAWGKIVGRLASHGVDIGDATALTGSLNRGNVFFSVRALGGDRYRVTPTYVVSGPYLEVWDPVRHTVTIESKTEAVIQSMLARSP